MKQRLLTISVNTRYRVIFACLYTGEVRELVMWSGKWSPCIYYAVYVWYGRVWVRDISGGMASVRYIDYGNEDSVPRQMLRQLPDNYWNRRPVAMPCYARSFSNDCPGQLLLCILFILILLS